MNLESEQLLSYHIRSIFNCGNFGYQSISKRMCGRTHPLKHLKALKVKLLRFVTSCSRCPLLGFSHLQPPFTLHKARCVLFV